MCVYFDCELVLILIFTVIQKNNNYNKQELNGGK